MVAGAATVGIGMIVFGAIVFGLVLGVALFALRQHNRMFPKRWDRTGWEPRSTRGWFATKFTWLLRRARLGSPPETAERTASIADRAVIEVVASA